MGSTCCSEPRKPPKSSLPPTLASPLQRRYSLVITQLAEEQRKVAQLEGGLQSVEKERESQRETIDRLRKELKDCEETAERLRRAKEKYHKLANTAQKLKREEKATQVDPQFASLESEIDLTMQQLTSAFASFDQQKSQMDLHFDSSRTPAASSSTQETYHKYEEEEYEVSAGKRLYWTLVVLGWVARLKARRCHHRVNTTIGKLKESDLDRTALISRLERLLEWLTVRSSHGLDPLRSSIRALVKGITLIISVSAINRVDVVATGPSTAEFLHRRSPLQGFLEALGETAFVLGLLGGEKRERGKNSDSDLVSGGLLATIDKAVDALMRGKHSIVYEEYLKLKERHAIYAEKKRTIVGKTAEVLIGLRTEEETVGNGLELLFSALHSSGFLSITQGVAKESVRDDQHQDHSLAELIKKAKSRRSRAVSHTSVDLTPARVPVSHSGSPTRKSWSNVFSSLIKQ